jgi:hypothetical protein
MGLEKGESAGYCDTLKEVEGLLRDTIKTEIVRMLLYVSTLGRSGG